MAGNLMQVLKIGGNELDDPDFRRGLAQVVARATEPTVVVHGGGTAIAALQQRLGLSPRKVNGLRVTDSSSLDVAQMVLSGQVNKRLVATLLAAGVNAIGLSGVDGGLLRCVKKEHDGIDLGLVGEIVEVRPRILQLLCEQGFVPVVSPISLGVDGQTYNVNADEAAAAVAHALRAYSLIFISNVPGVLDADGIPLASLTASATEPLIQNGVIRGGMVPKVQAALSVVRNGVPQARIVDLRGFGSGGGTTFLQ
jgi:acetylglutamate kinase